MLHLLLLLEYVQLMVLLVLLVLHVHHTLLLKQIRLLVQLDLMEYNVFMDMPLVKLLGQSLVDLKIVVMLLVQQMIYVQDK